MSDTLQCDRCKGDIPTDDDGWILEEDIAEAYIPPEGDNVLVHAECMGELYELC